jgi:hypothetical protein
VNAIQKPLSGLKNVLKRLTKHFKGFSSGFTELHTKFAADTLHNFASHHSQNKTHEVEKAQCVFTARCHVAD